jgi:hypothetical protein
MQALRSIVKGYFDRSKKSQQPRWQLAWNYAALMGTLQGGTNFVTEKSILALKRGSSNTFFQFAQLIVP